MTRTILGTMVAAAAIAGCASTPQPTPLAGPPGEIAALEGEWIGEYNAYDPSRRSGTLLFRLEADQDTAYGDVLMHLGGQETAPVIPLTTDPWDDVAPMHLLHVTFVPSADGSVFGRLDTYNDPLCGCEVRTTFTGHVQGNFIEGSYTTEHLNGADRTTGRWRVVRTFPD